MLSKTSCGSHPFDPPFNTRLDYFGQRCTYILPFPGLVFGEMEKDSCRLFFADDIRLPESAFDDGRVCVSIPMAALFSFGRRAPRRFFIARFVPTVSLPNRFLMRVLLSSMPSPVHVVVAWRPADLPNFGIIFQSGEYGVHEYTRRFPRAR